MASKFERMIEELKKAQAARQTALQNRQQTRQTLMDQLDFMTDPMAGQSAFTQMALDATPGQDTFATQAAMRGGSFAQAREAQQAAQSRNVGQALSGFSQNQLRRQQGATQGLMGLMNLDQQAQQLSLQRQQFRASQKGPGIGGILGTIGGTLLGSVAGPLGATVGGRLGNSLADNIFGSFNSQGPDDTNMPGPAGLYGIG